MLIDDKQIKQKQIHGQFESMIPLLMYHQKLSPQAAIDRSVAMLHESYERFYTAEQKLYDEVKADDDPDHLIEVKAYVQLFKDIVMGNLHWRLVLFPFPLLTIPQHVYQTHTHTHTHEPSSKSIRIHTKREERE